MTAFREQGLEFWHRGMWRTDELSGMPAILGRLLILLARSLYIVVDAFRQDRIRLRAATLTFVTMLSLVPLLAVAFSLFTAFGGLAEAGDRIRELVVDAIAVQQREVVTEYLDRFVSGANAGGLGAVGSIFLFVTAVSTLSNIETAFNDIWGVSEARGWIQRFQVYLPLVTLGPVLLGVSFSSIVAVEGSAAVKALVEAAPGLKALFGLGPLLLYGLLFSGLYLFLPNTRVRVGPALLGGGLAGALWVVGQRLFTVYAGRAISYSAIYGSFGAVPVTILWIYVSWTVVLLGATVSFALQSARTYEPERDIRSREREHAATRLVLVVARRFREGLGPTPEQTLIDEAGVPPRLGRRLLETLVDGEVLIKVLLEGDDLGFAPGRPLARTDLADVVEVLRGRAPEGVWDGRALLEEAAALERQKLASVSLERLLAEADADTVDPGTPRNSESLGPTSRVEAASEAPDA